MITYATSSRCRQQMLLEYFGEKQIMNVAIATTVSNEKTRDRLKKFSDTNCERDTATARNGAISRNEIVESLPYPENEVIESLRFLQDEGFITACEDGIHYKNK